MLAGMICSLASQQRRLLGQKHISFSRDQGGVRGQAMATAATADSTAGRRRRRPTERSARTTSQQEPQQQQQPQQQQLDDRTLKQHQRQQHQQLDERTLRAASSSRTDRDQDQHRAQAREQFLQQASRLGLARASELEGRPPQQRVTELPWSLSEPQQDTASASSSSGRSGSPASSSSADVLTDSSSTFSSGPTTSSSERSSTDANVSSFRRSRRSRSSSSRGDSNSEPDSSTSSMQLGGDEDDQAVLAAISRISRFMEFRERCASEVLQKLADVGYDRAFAAKVLERMQETNMQDDGRFAEMFVRGQWAVKSQAPAKIVYELRSRRVAQEHIDTALRSVFGSSQQIAGREPTDDQQAAAWERLVEACRRRVEATEGEPRQKRRAKLATWLQRRGHSLATAYRMFEELGI